MAPNESTTQNYAPQCEPLLVSRESAELALLRTLPGPIARSSLELLDRRLDRPAWRMLSSVPPFIVFCGTWLAIVGTPILIFALLFLLVVISFWPLLVALLPLLVASFATCSAIFLAAAALTWPHRRAIAAFLAERALFLLPFYGVFATVAVSLFSVWWSLVLGACFFIQGEVCPARTETETERDRDRPTE